MSQASTRCRDHYNDANIHTAHQSILLLSSDPKIEDLPRPRPKVLTRRHRPLNSGIQAIHRTGWGRISPPVRRRGVRQIKSQENDNGRYGETDIQARRSEVIEAHPPATVFVHDVLVEHESDDTPREIVERSGRRQVSGSAENDGCGKVADVSLWEHAGADIDDDGEEGAHEPEIEETAVEVSGGEDALWADETPDDGGVEEDSAVGACVMVLLVFCADVLDGA